MKRIEDYKWELSSGRELYVVCDTFGLSPTDGTVHTGFDHTLHGANVLTDPDNFDPELHDPAWTPAERAELADYMIAQWQEFKVRR